MASKALIMCFTDLSDDAGAGNVQANVKYINPTTKQADGFAVTTVFAWTDNLATVKAKVRDQVISDGALLGHTLTSNDIVFPDLSKG